MVLRVNWNTVVNAGAKKMSLELDQKGKYIIEKEQKEIREGKTIFSIFC